jgi:hypothetical protein
MGVRRLTRSWHRRLPVFAPGTIALSSITATPEKFMTHSITTTADWSYSTIPHLPLPHCYKNESSYQLLIDIEASPTISHLLRWLSPICHCHCSTRGFKRSAPTQNCCRMSSPPGYSTISPIPSWRQVVPDLNVCIASKTAAAQTMNGSPYTRGKSGLGFHEPGSQISKEIGLGHFMEESMYFIRFQLQVSILQLYGDVHNILHETPRPLKKLHVHFICRHMIPFEYTLNSISYGLVYLYF